jgi:addiction module RelE/StbE family toxin
MSKYSIEITEPAENDLYEIASYTAKELLEPEIAKEVVAKIAEEIFSLADMPLQNALVADARLSLQGIRKIVVDNYIVFYIANEESKIVTIIKILYGRRDWINLL